jgi:hypothetical protein
MEWGGGGGWPFAVEWECAGWLLGVRRKNGGCGCGSVQGVGGTWCGGGSRWGGGRVYWGGGGKWAVGAGRGGGPCAGGGTGGGGGSMAVVFGRRRGGRLGSGALRFQVVDCARASPPRPRCVPPPARAVGGPATPRRPAPPAGPARRSPPPPSAALPHTPCSPPPPPASWPARQRAAKRRPAPPTTRTASPRAHRAGRKSRGPRPSHLLSPPPPPPTRYPPPARPAAHDPTGSNSVRRLAKRLGEGQSRFQMHSEGCSGSSFGSPSLLSSDLVLFFSNVTIPRVSLTRNPHTPSVPKKKGQKSKTLCFLVFFLWGLLVASIFLSSHAAHHPSTHGASIGCAPPCLDRRPPSGASPLARLAPFVSTAPRAWPPAPCALRPPPPRSVV